MSSIVITIVIASLGSAGLFSFITFLIQRRDNKKDMIKQLQEAHAKDVETLREERDEMLGEVKDMLREISNQTVKNEKDNIRTQLLLLMADYPDNTSELMRCAEHYFKDLKANWYLTPIFAKYLRDKGIAAPEWLLN